ncbi:MAG TPA: S8 family peptidase, partial [Candidatus Eisenbacteria bacterium]|nr:S8 family peptidase [Candidatus Eisenbacteria bacterium]
VCSLVNAAVTQGMIVVTSAGNHADCGQLSSPGAADAAITVGAYDAGSDPGSADDALAAFTAYGPRADDQDGTHADEMKPDVVAPGVNVVSAWGSPASSGHAYAPASGTSMSAALVSGVVALLLEEDPSLTPAAVKQHPRDTACHRADGGLACGVQDPFGIDARYHTGWGFGEVDAVAALEELRHGNQTQFVQLEASWNAATQHVDVTWTTQREKNISSFDLERAPELNGGPGTFGTVGTTPALGPGTLAPVNRTTYLLSDAAPAGGNWWYRVKTAGGNTLSPTIRVRTESPAALVRVELDHNTPESDLVLTVGSGIPQSAPVWVKAVDIREHAISVDVPAPQDLVQHALVVPLYGDVAGTLPPLASSPWWVRAVEGGNPERTGWLRDFSVTAGGTTYDTDSSTPEATEEGGATSLWIPEPAALGIPGDHRGVSTVVAAPNPFRSRVDIDFEATGNVLRVTVHDLSGREVRVLWRGQGGDIHLTWDGRDARGRNLPAGAYFLRIEEGSQVRALRLVRLP